MKRDPDDIRRIRRTLAAAANPVTTFTAGGKRHKQKPITLATLGKKIVEEIEHQDADVEHEPAPEVSTHGGKRAGSGRKTKYG